MAAFRHLANQVFNKAAIEAKYKGSIDDFKKEFNWGSPNDQEDGYLLVISKMNFDELDGDDCLIQAGLERNDFALIGRYGNYREVDWLVDAGEFFWHIEENKEIGHYKEWIGQYSIQDMLKIYGENDPLGNMLKAINDRTLIKLNDNVPIKMSSHAHSSKKKESKEFESIDFYTEVARMYNNLDTAYIRNLLSPEIKYGSHMSYREPISTRQELISWLNQKFESFKRDNFKVRAELAETMAGEPIILFHAPNNKGELQPYCTITLLTKNQQIIQLWLCVIPSVHDVAPTGISPV